MKTKKPKEKYRYCLPNFLAKAMSKVSMRTQMESSMLSQFLLLIGLTIMVLFTIFSGEVGGFQKFMIIFNLLCGWVLISSYLITTYQQYTNYAGAIGYDPDAEKAKVKKRGNIFKRISHAFKRRKKKRERKKESSKNEPLAPQLTKEALENKNKFGIDLKFEEAL